MLAPVPLSTTFHNLPPGAKNYTKRKGSCQGKNQKGKKIFFYNFQGVNKESSDKKNKICQQRGKEVPRGEGRQEISGQNRPVLGL
jgi:hypothetical protein